MMIQSNTENTQKMIDGRKSKPKPQNPLHVLAKKRVALVLSERQWRFAAYVEILVKSTISL